MKRFLIFIILAFCINGVYGQKVLKKAKGEPHTKIGRGIERRRVSRDLKRVSRDLKLKIERLRLEVRHQREFDRRHSQSFLTSRKSDTQNSAHDKIMDPVSLYEDIHREQERRRIHEGSHIQPSLQQEPPFNPSEYKRLFEIPEPLNFHQKRLFEIPEPTNFHQKLLKSALQQYTIIQLLLDIRHTNPHLRSLQFENLLEHYIDKSNNARPENRINKNNAVLQRVKTVRKSYIEEKRKSQQEITPHLPNPQRMEIENSTTVPEPSNLLQENKEFQIEQVKESMPDWQLKLMEKVNQRIQKINISIIKGNNHTLYGDNLRIENENYYSNYAA